MPLMMYAARGYGGTIYRILQSEAVTLKMYRDNSVDFDL
jgi:hypothetical protein